MRLFARPHGVRLEVRLHDSAVYLAGPSEHALSDAYHQQSDSVASTSTSTSHPASLRGSVAFNLETPTTFKSLRVTLQGHISTRSGSVLSSSTGSKIKYASANSTSEQYETLRHEVDLLYDHQPAFAAGSHNLEFAILLPATLPPSLDCASARLAYTLTASAQDAHTNLQSSSKAREVQIISTGVPGALDGTSSSDDALVDMVSYNHAVGPFSARLVSDQPTVGSLLYLHLYLPSPSPGVKLYQVSVSAVQETKITSKRHGKSSSTTLEKHLMRLFNQPYGEGFSEVPPIVSQLDDIRPWKVGDEVTLEHMLRLPTHKYFSPSTPKNAHRDPDAPLNVTIKHSISLRIRYGLSSSAVKELQISRDFTLLSCKCVSDTVVPPAYSPAGPASTKTPSGASRIFAAFAHSGSASGGHSSTNETSGPSSSQYGYTAPGLACACLRTADLEQISSLWKERLAAPPDSQTVGKVMQT